jgi:type 1 glutamine amidotransferase/nicotinamidase-related amidase
MRTPIFPLAAACLFAAVAAPLRAEGPPAPLKVCLVSGSEEYDSDRSLAILADYLESRGLAECTLLKAKGFDDLPGLEALDDCDAAVFFTRRLTIDGDQLERIKKYATSGRPLVAIRTASHGFQNWLEFDKLVLGGNYQNHRSNDVTTRAVVAGAGKGHPVTRGVGTIATQGSLYKNTPPAGDVTVLMTGTSPEGTEPVAWTREVNGGRVFYTSIGAQGDFLNQTYLRLLANGLLWSAGRDVPEPAAPAAQPPLRPAASGTIRLTLRSRVEPFKGSGERRPVTLTKEVPASECAIVICDMWDRHWCSGATARCDAIAARMAPVVEAARKRGVQVVHAPSECMDFYAGLPQRLRAQLAPKASPPEPRELPAEPPLPIDDSDGGCDTDDSMYLAWTRQNPRIGVGEFDAVSDDGDEIYNLLRQLGAKYVFVMGVHTNMCILNRTFAIRAMSRRGMDCILVRDFTDTMYDPKDRPFVPHDRGTELVVEHIETYLCPSVLGEDLIDD